MNALSNSLSTFKGVYSYWPSMKGSQESISEDLLLISGAIDSAISGYKQASADKQITELCSCCSLAKEAVDRVKSHIDGDLDSLFSNGDQVKSYIDEIEDKIASGGKLKTAWYEDVWNYTIGALVKEWRVGDQPKIDQLNREIDHLNQKGEAQLKAMSTAINSVQFGIAGNMKHGGSLGANVSYSDNYNFSPEKWEEENPIIVLNTFQEIGCLLVGAVEGVLKVAEGIVDAALTIVGNVVTLGGLWEGGADFFEKIISYDVAGEITRPIGALIAGSEDAYNQSGGRKVGYFIGKTAGTIVATVYGGPLLMAASVMGNKSEQTLQDGGSLLEAGWEGLKAGAVAYATYHVAAWAGGKLSAGLTKLGNYANSAATGTIRNAIGRTMAKAVTGVTGVVGKVLNTATKPFVNAGMYLRTATPTLSNVSNALWAADASIMNGFHSVTGAVRNGVGRVKTAVKSGTNNVKNSIKAKFGHNNNPLNGANNGNPISGSGPPVGSNLSASDYNLSQDVYDDLVMNSGFSPGSNEFNQMAVEAGGTLPKANVASASGSGAPTSGTGNPTGGTGNPTGGTGNPTGTGTGAKPNINDYGNVGTPGMTENTMKYQDALHTAREAVHNGTVGSPESVDAVSRLAATYGKGPGGGLIDPTNGFNTLENEAAYLGHRLMNGTATAAQVNRYQEIVYELTGYGDVVNDYIADEAARYAADLAAYNAGGTTGGVTGGVTGGTTGGTSNDFGLKEVVATVLAEDKT